MRCALLLAVVLTTALIVNAGPSRGKKRRGKGPDVRSGSCEGSLMSKPKVKAGRVAFGDEAEVVLRVSGRKPKRARMRKVNGGLDNPELSSMKDEQSAVYADNDLSVVCRKDCDDTGECVEYCMEHTEDQGCFVSGDKAICMDNDEGALVDMVVPKASDYIVRNKPSSRSRRSLVPDLNAVGYVRMIFHFDDAFMNIFKTIAGGSATGAQTEATKYVKLIANEMTISYQTLKQYGLSFTLAGTTHNLDFAMYVAHVQFPTIVNNEFVNVDWSANSLVGGTISDSGLTNFRLFIANDYTAPVGVDHHAAMTGYDLSGSTIGIAYLSTLCEANSKAAGLTTSINQQFGSMARLLAHELGHGMGSDHDDGSTGCETGTYIMSSFIANPSASNKDTYHTFSSCSADDLRDHFNSISSSNYDTGCLYNSGITDSDFLADFCTGFRGTGFTLEDMCKLAYGSASTVCSGSLAASGYVTSCLPSYGCTSGSSCFFITEVPPGTKCTEDNTLGDNVCFKGNCVSGLEICPASTTTTTTAPLTTTTTAAPVTTTTTAAPVTTTTTAAPVTTTTTAAPVTTTTTAAPVTTTTTAAPVTTTTTAAPVTTTTTAAPVTTTTTAAPVTTTTTAAPVTTTTTAAPVTTTTTAAPVTTTTTAAPVTTTTAAPVTTTTTAAPVTTTTAAPVTTTTTAAPATTTTTAAPVTTTTTAAPVTTTTTVAPVTTTEAPRCFCRTFRCCRRSTPNCCRGCRRTRSGRCVRRRRRWWG